MKFAKQSLTAFLCTILLVACSGSDGGSAAPLPMPSSMAKIDAVSATLIAGEVVDSVLASGSFGDILSGGGPGSLAGKADNGLSKAGGLLDYFASVSIPDTTSLCAVDGSVTVTGQVASPITLSAGDRLRFEFFDCDDGAGQVLNGIYEMVVNNFSGDVLQGLFNLIAAMTFDGFEVTERLEMTALSGATTLNLDTSIPLMTSVSVSGASLSVNGRTDSATLTEFRTEVTHNAGVAPEAYTLAASGTLTSTVFEGEVNYNTPVPLQGFVGEYPFPGELLVTGEGGTSLRLMALDNINVRLEIDPGDGSGIVTQDTNWVELANAVSADATGITGQVLRGPIVPGPEAPGQINEEPFSALFSVLNSENNTVVRFESDDNGNFTVLLLPGEYTIVPDASAPILFPEQQMKLVIVPEGGFADVILMFDTGIR